MTDETSVPQEPVLVVMGVSGTGKSTVAGILAGRLGWDLEEGDDLHPQQNVAKMAAGIALTDDDRWPWLDEVRAWIRERTDAGRPGVITCSALRRSYRDRIRGDHVLFVHMVGRPDVIGRRIAARAGHFMPAALLTSQMSILDPLEPDEEGFEVEVKGTPADVASEILSRLRLPTG